MSINRRQFLGLLLAAGASPLLRAQDKLTLWGPPVAPTLLLAVAAEHGQAKNIIPFQVKTWKNPDQLRAGLMNRSIEVSIVPCYVAANLRAQGQAVKLHNIMTRGLLHVLAKNEAKTDIQALHGQKMVATFKNDMPDLLWQLISQKNKIQTETTFAATPPEALLMFLKQDFSYAMLPEPLASMALAKAKEMNIQVQRAFSLTDFWGGTAGIPQAGLMVSESFQQSHAAFLTALDQDLHDAVRWVEENPTAAAEIGQQYLPAPVPVLAQSLPHSALSALRTRDIAQEVLDFLAALHALNPKIVGGKMPDASLFS